jgi:transcription-repair coupling factor (superfamily II helicase)
MQFLLDTICNLAAYQHLLESLRAGEHLPGLGLPRAARLPVLAALHQDLDRPVLLLTDRADHALSLADELPFWLPQTRLSLFPEPNPLFYEQGAWGASTRRERLQALVALARYQLPSVEKPSSPLVIVASARAVMTRTLPRRDFLKASHTFNTGQSKQTESLLFEWTSIGYQSADTVLEPGYFAHRGGILDIWPPDENFPFRLEFFGNEIETIRRFDPASQRTVEELDSVLITPAREFIVRESGNANSESKWRTNLDPQSAITDLSEFHIPVLHPYLDYLPPGALILVDDLSLVVDTMDEVEEQAVALRRESISEGSLPEDFPVPYLTRSEVIDGLQNHAWLELGHSTEAVVSDEAESPTLAAQFGQEQRFGGRLKPFLEHLTKLTLNGNQVVIVSRQSERLRELWQQSPDLEQMEAPSEVKYPHSGRMQPLFVEASLSEGWVLGDVRLITDSEVFGWERPQPRQRPRQAAETPESAYADFQPGDWVVHIDYGVGRYVGLVQRRLEGLEREFLAVEYQNGDQLFVPIHQADRLTRYVGPDASPPPLGHLGGQEWSETKRRVREAVRQVAAELLDLYARRRVAEGYAFGQDTAWQAELEASFPYIETEDQLRVIDEVKQDMELPRPMDRLLCGDVGYGKTEVALRAAFKAVSDSKQVAMLVPTTVLAQQHFETFRQRLSAYPVTVEMLSRFRTPREQNEILYGLATGAVDIVIGTHRLIQPDVAFKDLGLVVIDEEQRFGVTHKEHLKRLRTEVDVLTMTATPIPRTLYMALTGVRDISTLNTPPEERLPIVTHVGPYSPRLVRQAILRELGRGGQVFFVHNRVQTIDAMRAHLGQLLPEARLAIAHGQMPENELADVMHRFSAGELDVLLSTSIIESGLDIPNANTMIVDRADAFGLAQLYQLRGRVGRGAVRAYAYFFRHRRRTPTIEGQARLEVIAENTQLGSGYSIAMRDLEMRGAGEVLGTRQHGHIASVGFHLYTRLLGSAVRALRREHGLPLPADPAELLRETGLPVNVDLPLNSGIPVDYIPDQNLRLRLYRRLADLIDEAGLESLAAEFGDRFGPLPESVENLFYQVRVKLYAEAAGLISVSMEDGQIVLRYPAPQNELESQRMPDLGEGIRGGKNAYWLTFGREPDWPERLLETLAVLPRAEQASAR